jgi:hypothetical protein
MDATRSFTVNWNERKIHVDRVYRVVLRNKPFTVEVRASGEDRQAVLLSLVGRDAGISDLSADLAVCDLSDEKKRNRLDKKLKARFCGSDINCTTDRLSSMKLRSADDERLDDSDEYNDQIDREGRDEVRRTYEFRTIHSDGYEEIAEYTVAVGSGEVRVSGASSELAIENLRQHVVALF